MRQDKLQKYEDGIEPLILHFMDVNGCSREEFNEHKSKAFKEHQERSQHKNWQVDWGTYQQFVDESRANT